MGIKPTERETPTGTSRRAFLTASAASAAAVAIPLVAGSSPATGAPATLTGSGPGIPPTRQTPDTGRRVILKDIAASNIEAIVRRLAAFGTRHTLSSQTDPVRGIGAARDWIYQTLQGYAAASGGRMTVEIQSYLQAPGPRIPT